MLASPASAPKSPPVPLPSWVQVIVFIAMLHRFQLLQGKKGWRLQKRDLNLHSLEN